MKSTEIGACRLAFSTSDIENVHLHLLETFPVFTHAVDLLVPNEISDCKVVEYLQNMLLPEVSYIFFKFVTRSETRS